MGVVYRARQQRPNRLVALKVLTPESLEGEEDRTRFEAETQVAAAIEHPNVIPVYRVDEAEGLLFIAMRFVEGETLRELIQRGVSAERAVNLIGQTAGALDAAHARGLVHRDVKPSNVLVSDAEDRPHAYLTDFGLSKRVDTASTLTRSGELLGTPDYMAPEQVRGEAVDARTDVYALACTLFQALSGEVPFPRDNSYAKLFAHANEPPPSLPNTELPSALDEVVRRGMAKDPEDRYPSAGNLGQAAVAALGRAPLPVSEQTVAAGAAAPRAPTVTTVADDRTPRTRVLRSRRSVAALGALFALVSVGAVLVTLRARGSSGARPDAQARTGRLVGQPIPVQRNPTAIAASAGKVWVASARAGTISHIDGRSGRPEGRPVKVGREPAGVAVGLGSVWVANARDDTVTRLDPRTAKPRGGPIPVGDQPLDVTVGEGAVWTANVRDGTVSRIDARTRRVSSIRVGAAPVDVVAGQGAVWAANAADDTLSRINPVTKRAEGSAIPAGQAPDSLTTTPGVVWVGNIDSDEVRRVDVKSSQVTGAPIRVGERPDDVTAWDGAVYVANQDANSVTRIDAAARKVVGRPLLVGNEPIALAADGENLWILNFGAENVVRVRP